MENPTCQAIYKTLLKCNPGGQSDVTASAYARELMETARCDGHYDLKAVREDFITKINKGDTQRMPRVIANRPGRESCGASGTAQRRLARKKSRQSTDLAELAPLSDFWSCGAHAG
jgi:hypothetical protein